MWGVSHSGAPIYQGEYGGPRKGSYKIYMWTNAQLSSKSSIVAGPTSTSPRLDSLGASTRLLEMGCKQKGFLD